MTTALSVASLLVAVLALLVSTGVAWRQLSRMRESNMLPVTLDMFREFRTHEFRAAMRYLVEDLWTEHPPGTTGITALPDDARARLTEVISYFNNVGLLLHQGIVDERVIQGFMGGSLLRAWDRVAPYLRVERALRDDPIFYGFFEHAVARCDAVTREELRDRLRLATMPEDWSFDVTPYVRPTRKPAP